MGKIVRLKPHGAFRREATALRTRTPAAPAGLPPTSRGIPVHGCVSRPRRTRAPSRSRASGVPGRLSVLPLPTWPADSARAHRGLDLTLRQAGGPAMKQMVVDGGLDSALLAPGTTTAPSPLPASTGPSSAKWPAGTYCCASFAPGSAWLRPAKSRTQPPPARGGCDTPVPLIPQRAARMCEPHHEDGQERAQHLGVRRQGGVRPSPRTRTRDGRAPGEGLPRPSPRGPTGAVRTADPGPLPRVSSASALTAYFTGFGCPKIRWLWGILFLAAGARLWPLPWP